MNAVNTQTYVLRLVNIREEKLSESKRVIDETRCFTTGGLEDPHWVCRGHREYVHLKDSHLIVSKYYLNCTQANKVGPEENPQFVLCSSSVLEYVYELVPVSREELITKMRRIAENARRFGTVLVGSILYAVKHHDKLYVLDFFYDPIMHAVRAIIKYIIPI